MDSATVPDGSAQNERWWRWRFDLLCHFDLTLSLVLASVHAAGSTRTQLHYKANGIRTSMTHGNCNTVSYAYNPRNQLTQILHRTAARASVGDESQPGCQRAAHAD